MTALAALVLPLLLSLPAAGQKLRIVAANLTSGSQQSYDPGHGGRILKGLEPDIVLIQEFNYGTNSPANLRSFVNANFGTTFSYYHEGNYNIPNGIISRYPIIASGSWNDPQVSDREFAWARIDIPGDKDLWAVSVHMLTTDSKRPAQATALRNFIQANVPAAAYLVIGGDFNSDTRTETQFSTLSAVVDVSGPYPADRNGNTNTNAGRSSPYDGVLPDPDLHALEVPVVIGTQTFPNGFVADTRVHSPISDLEPALSSDSAASGMQHMAVVKDFQLPSLTPKIVTTTLPGGNAGSAYTVTLSGEDGTEPYTWSLASGSLPPGLSLGTSSGTISGTPTTSGTFNFSARLTDRNGGTVTSALSIAVSPALVVSSAATLPEDTANTSYPEILEAGGGTAPYSWQIVSGSVPTGLSLASGGNFTGTSSAAGTFSFTARVTDAQGFTASRAFTLRINAAPSITSIPPLPGGTAGTAWAFDFENTGGTQPVAWSIASGTLPAGLGLGADGRLAGTPSSAGTFSFAVRVTDGTGAIATKTMGMTVAAALQITTASPLNGGTVGTAMSRLLVRTGGTSPYVWNISAGSLPAGLSMSTAGMISGTPTAAGGFTFSARVTDAAGAVATKQIALSITAALAISTTSLPDAPAGNSYSEALVATGGSGVYQWAVISGSPPAGLTLSAAGVLAGTPSEAGSSAFSVRVTDDVGAVAVRELSISVTAALAVSTTPLPDGVVGSAYSHSLQVSGGLPPYQWAILSGSLPDGITLSTSGTLAGIPEKAGGAFVVRVSDSAGASTEATLSLVVKEPFALYLEAAGITAGDAAMDSDGDGIPNLLEFLLGGNAKAADAGISPKLLLSPDHASLSFSFRVPASPGSITWKVRSSGDLREWHDVTEGEGTIISVTGAVDGMKDISVTMPAPAGFIYLRLEAVAP